MVLLLMLFAIVFLFFSSIPKGERLGALGYFICGTFLDVNYGDSCRK